jgi:hypothetical protein
MWLERKMISCKILTFDKKELLFSSQLALLGWKDSICFLKVYTPGTQSPENTFHSISLVEENRKLALKNSFFLEIMRAALLCMTDNPFALLLCQLRCCPDK